METVLTASPLAVRLPAQASFNIGEISEVAAARRAGNELAHRLGFDETLTGRLALVITEAGTNILKHATRGEILLRGLQDGDAYGVEVIVIDKGPGIADLAQSMRDGITSGESYGVGMGAMRRLSSDFDIYTDAQTGTAIYMNLWARPERRTPAPWLIGAVCLPIPGEDICGDAWTAQVDEHLLRVMLADGLGHGPLAAEASQTAVDVAVERRRLTPLRLLEEAHGRLHATRGAAISIALMDAQRDELVFAGIGNVVACVSLADKWRHSVTHSGIVGNNMRKLQEFTSTIEPNATLIMHSDGINTRWDLSKYPGLAYKHPGLIAAVLYRDHSRGRDDVTVVAARHNGNARSSRAAAGLTGTP